MALKKIVAIGPESTGKSMLSEHLAAHYHSNWCPEYAREYLPKNGTNYTYENLLDVAKGQILREDECIANAIAAGQHIVFIDTDLYVMKVWCEFVFGKCHQYILDQIQERKYDLYLLCKTDLPWVKDELREYPDLERRQQLYHIYRDLMVNQQVPWVEVSGNYEQRFHIATTAIERL